MASNRICCGAHREARPFIPDFVALWLQFGMKS
jgi:hypothetical protein